MTKPKDQLNLYYEQQKILIEQIKSMREELNTEQKLTTRYRKQRDRLKVERQALMEKTLPEVESRDSKKEIIEGLKKRRDFLKRQSRRTEGAPFKILSSSELEQLTLVELKFHLYELEFKQQTSSLARDEEEIIIDEIKRIEERIFLLEKRNEAIVADYLGNVPESKEKIDEEISTIEEKLSQEASLNREMQNKMQNIYKRIGPLKEEEDKAHQEFVSHLQRVEELKVDIQAKQEELDAMKGKITQVKKIQKQEEHKATYGKIEERIQELIKKKDTGKELTPEEQEFLMSYGYVPF
jgi:uncharacterized coiled-coil DUF342 family protein